MSNRLFRGKQKSDGKWLVGCGIIETDNWVSIFTVTDDIDENYADVTEYEVIPETVGQYIYERDMNGINIFTDDIIEYRNERYKVGCVDRGKRVIALRENGVFAFVPWERVEIIGNIHDNPELLKGGEEE